MAKRPGTVDYSKFENLDFSDDSEDERQREERERRYAVQAQQERRARRERERTQNRNQQQRGAGEQEDEGEDESDNESDYYDCEEEGEYASSESDNEEEESDESSSDDVPTSGTRRILRAVRPPPSRPPNNNPPARRMPEASLATLQRAWGTRVDAKGDIDGSVVSKGTNDDDNGRGNLKDDTDRTCAACHQPTPPFRCSRCKLVWFCNVRCQAAYHPIHKKECVDADKHMAYWGFLNQDSSSKNEDDNDNDTPPLSKEEQRAALQRALEARLSLRRRRALKRAAAAEAVRRARLAREARGNAKGPAKGKGAEKEETCPICQCEFTVSGDSGVGLCCPSSHHMCSECAGVFVNSVIGDLEASYPPRCPMCRGAFALDHFMGQLNTKQQAQVKAFAAQRALKPGQCLVKCPQCDHYEVQKAPGDCIWWCGGCGLGTCFVCNAELSGSIQKYDIEKSPHALCKKLRTAKAKVEEAIEQGSKMCCPSCGLAGRKDDACTHMTCPRCSCMWCYICGLSARDCDKAPPRPGSDHRPADDIFLHNQDWETNELRCPMYMTQILEVDLHWLGEDWEQRATDADFEDDDKCLDYFHRFRTIKKLQEVRDEIGPRDFVSTFVHFDSIKNSGYTIDDVINTSTDKLIDRTEYLYYREEEEQEQEGRDGPNGAARAAHGGNVLGGLAQGQDLPEEALRAVMGNVGQAMLGAAEDEQVRMALAASEASAQEDEQLRMAMEESRGGQD